MTRVTSYSDTVLPSQCNTLADVGLPLYSRNHSAVRFDCTEPSGQLEPMDKKGVLWLGTKDGLAYLHSEGDNHLIKYPRLNGKPRFDQPALALYADTDSTLWIGSTDAGLFKYDTVSNHYEKFTGMADLAKTAEIYAILPDNHHQLWLSTSNGLLRTNKLTDKAHLFNRSDGLQSELFYYRSALRAADGRLFFGGRKGFNRFYPEQININSKPPKVALTGLSHFNQPLELAGSYQGFTLSQPVSQTKTLKLSHRDYVFGFDFAALDFADPQRNQYAYRMTGFDQNWNHTDAANRRATYTNLAPGDYTFEVKAAGKDGVWNEQGLSVAVKVLAAPWATPWAYIVYLLLCLAGIFAYLKHRTATLTKRAEQLQQSVQQRTLELGQEKQRVEQLLAQKHDEFANVSHEFRTPLTLVLGPLTQILAGDISDGLRHKLTVVKRNGNRLLRMVDQLLHMEKFKVQQSGEKATQALRPLLTLINQSFQDLIEQQNISLAINCSDAIYLTMTPDALEKILLNLISNALKYTPDGGNIQVKATLTDSQKVSIEVTDSGIGITPEKQQWVFERFHRVLDQQSEHVTGAGIGLALVKALVEAHQGQISLLSEERIGTTITVILPATVAVNNTALTTINQELIDIEREGFSQQLTAPAIDTIESDESNKTKVLVVEDNPDMRQYIRETLSEHYHCLLEADGKAGLQRAISDIPDIIISDVMMPQMDGYQLTRAIKSDHRTSHIPLILLTAKDDRQSRLQGWQDKADEYLTKPFDPQELSVRIANLLAIRDILRQRFSQRLFSTTAPKPHEQGKLEAQAEFLNKLNQVMLTIYSRQEITIPQIAKQVAMSERQLFRKLKGSLGLNPTEYLRRYRLEKACTLLNQGMSSSQVALEVGFSTHSYFTRCFSAQYGCAPSQYSQESD